LEEGKPALMKHCVPQAERHECPGNNHLAGFLYQKKSAGKEFLAEEFDVGMSRKGFNRVVLVVRVQGIAEGGKEKVGVFLSLSYCF